MPPKTARSSSMKQGTLGFSSTKRVASTNAKPDVKGTKSLSTTPVTPAPKSVKRKASSIEIDSASSSPADSSSVNSGSDDVSVLALSPVPTKRSRASLKANMSAKDDAVVIVDEAKLELEDYPLKDNDKRWRKAVKQSQKVSETEVQVHKGEETDLHQMLRVFDMTYEYGPSIGLTRLERWERANTLGLKPPSEVREILLTKDGNGRNEYRLNVLDQLAEL
ncbi:DNA polymerase delta, subunit 4-domain-containing protein [Pterulicium gracile]|uniref:DNA polymerase delta, subunit 4-domain-containing protein n=1 Tax=Pterulicium gracile TaxID=1884261 RepID=A0A5C3QPQ2_9AGAR|nr:DNA polymerase delta, subunit 4-domain-containing protein [Pterula gracilis]